jgi:alkanesulfonate monooxygenase SsuD/methylene tetrahydromethanopterin reductase-like flavin-dependent oxidoreductase (luciferase family)
MLLPLVAMIRGEEVHHSGRYYQFDVAGLTPAPAKTPPIWIGARKSVARHRAALVDGWLAQFRTPEHLAADIEDLRAEAARLGRPAPEIGITFTASIESAERCIERQYLLYGTPREKTEKWAVGGIPQIRDRIDEYRDAGATRVSILFVEPPEDAWQAAANLLG